MTALCLFRAQHGSSFNGDPVNERLTKTRQRNAASAVVAERVFSRQKVQLVGARQPNDEGETRDYTLQGVGGKRGPTQNKQRHPAFS